MKKIFCLGCAFIFFVSFTTSCQKDRPLEKAPLNTEIQHSVFCSSDFYSTSQSGPTISGLGSNNYFFDNNPEGPIVITVKFIDGGSESVREKVEKYAKKWEEYANIRFDFVGSNKSALVRISFNKTQGTYVTGKGKSLFKNMDRFNMHYASLNDNATESQISRDVLHEFGHILGLYHEQTHHDIQWDRPYIYEYYKSKFGWLSKTVDMSFFNRVTHNYPENPRYSPYDSRSIMHYPYPKEFALNNEDGKFFGASELSEGDKKFIQEIYPFPSKKLFTIEACKVNSTPHLYKIKTTSKGHIFIQSLYEKHHLGICVNRNDRYLIIDPENKEYSFNLSTDFNPKTETGLKGDIRILKNGKQIFSNQN